MLPMSRIRLIVLSMLVVFTASAVAAVAAAAAPGCEEVGGEKCFWQVQGAQLKEKAAKEFTAGANKNFVLKGKVKAIAVELKWEKLKVKAGALLIGGEPGDNEEAFVLEGVKVEQPKNCKIPGEKIETLTLKSELVELVKGGVVQKVDDVLFEPKKGTVLAEVEFEGEKCPIANAGKLARLQGTVLAEPTNRFNKEAVVGHLIFTNEKLEYRKHASNVVVAAKLELETNLAELAGEANIELVTKEKWSTA
jgi:hypothetical protein